MPEKRILTNYQYVRPDNLLYKKKPSKITTVYTRDGANSITQTKRYAYTPQGKIPYHLIHILKDINIMYVVFWLRRV